MNKLKTYIVGAAAFMALAGGLSSCQDHFDEPNVNAGPVATMKANTTIAEVKAWLWNDELNYCDSVYTRDYYLLPDADKKNADPWNGEHVIVSGRVISSDYAGNCFRYITLQDETGALNFSIYSYNLYLEYRRGQEIVVDLTGMFMGKYGGLLQVGFPQFYSAINGYETSFMAPEIFRSHRELNGLPNTALIDTIEISSFIELATTPAGLQQWQSQLIRINNVTITSTIEGVNTLATYHATVSQTVTDASGITATLYTSGYANFWNMEIPEKPVDLVAIASYYVNTTGSGGWQLVLIDAEGIMTDPTVPKGSQENPYTTEEAIGIQVNSTTTTRAWVTGYIVGTVAPEVTEVGSNDDIEWTDAPILGNTMVIGPTADCTDISKCLVIELTQGTSLYDQSILNRPENYGKEIAILGSFEEVLGTFGVVTSGSTSDYVLDGQGGGGGSIAQGDGTEANPYNCAQVIAMSPQSTTEAVETGIWMGGYIVGYYSNYAGHFETAGAVNTNILMSDNPEASDVSQCVSVQLPIGKVRDALNLINNSAVFGKFVAVYGDVMKYNTLPGIKNTSNYAFGGNVPGEGDNPSNPGTGDFSETFASSQGAFTIDNITVPSALTSIWSHDASYGYMKASAFANNTSYASDSWLISPMLSLGSSSVLSFEHVTNKFTSLDIAKQQVSVAVRPEGGSWQTVTIPTWSTNNDWTFVNSGTINLSNYAGQKVQIGFHYTSADGSSGSWEVKNVLVTNASQTSGGSTGGDTPSDPGTGDTPSNPSNPSGSITETFTTEIGFPVGTQAAVPTSETLVTSTATGIKYTLFGTNVNSAGYLMIAGKVVEGAFISWSLDYNCSEIIMATTSGCSTNAKSQVEVYAGSQLIGTYPVNVQNAKVSVAVPAQYQAAGTIYKVVSTTNAYNQQFSSFTYVKSDGSSSNTPGTGGDTPGTGGDSPSTPGTGTYKGDFDSFNGGTASSTFKTYTNATGWTAENCAILAGGAGNNPHFSFIGSETTLAPTMNGNTASAGKIYSGTISGGCKTLTFNYGLPFTESANVQFTVNILQNGSVVKSQTVTVNASDKKVAQSFSMDANVAGDFQIQIVSGSAARSASAFGRVAIWNLTWTN